MKKIILLIIEKIRKALKVDEKGNSFGWRKGTLLLAALMMVGCNTAMDRLDITNGTKYIVTSKEQIVEDYHYRYRVIKIGDKWYDYYYTDTTDFNVGDTIVITIKRVSK